MDTTTSLEIELALPALLEALLFVAPGSVTIAQLTTVLNATSEEVQKALEQLSDHYHQASFMRGLRIQIHHGRVQLTTAPEAAGAIERFLGLESTSRLSRAAFETLAIVAYQQPITRPYIDSIRGVSSDAVIKGLMSKGLIQEVGRADAPGRPILYSTTSEFMQYFGLERLEDLPPLRLEEALKGGDETVQEDQNDE